MPLPPLSTRDIAAELAPFGIELTERGLEQLSLYLELLLRWNRRVNLTGLREPRTIVRRLFGESLSLSRVVELRGWLVDVGSGAGFPGLALKLVAPDRRVTLVEARQRKCAFLMEVVRECSFYAIDVVAERFESWVGGREWLEKADFITTRAVKADDRLLDCMSRILSDKGKAIFFARSDNAGSIMSHPTGLIWQEPFVIPSAKDSIILVGSHESSK